MDKQTFAVVIVIVALIVAYIGWSAYQTHTEAQHAYQVQLEHEKTEQERLKMEKQNLEQKMRKEQQQKQEEERLRKLEQEKNEKLNQETKNKIAQKTQEAIAKLKGLIESKGNGIIEKQDGDQVWQRTITDARLSLNDSTLTYTYRTGLNDENVIQITFMLKQIGKTKIISENAGRHTADYLEITSKFEQRVFNYCEHLIGKNQCDKQREINLFKVFFADRLSVIEAQDQMETIRKLRETDHETLKLWLEQGLL